jgi:hypothetical protein
MASVCLGAIPLKAPHTARASAAPRSLESYRAALLSHESVQAAAHPTFGLADVSPDEIVPGRLLVTFAPGVARDAALAALSGTADITADLSEIRTYEVSLRGKSLEDGIAALQKLPGVTAAEPVLRFQEQVHPNDPLYDQRQSAYLSTIDAEAAWDIQQGDPNVVVAVLDTGLMTDHPDLAAQLWTNPNPGQSGCGNDLHGCNFVDPKTVDDTCLNANQTPVPNADISPYDPHGTFVAGVIGAATNNGAGMAGLVPHASIMAVKVNSCNGTTETSVAQGLLYAAHHGARVVNISLGGESHCRIFPAAMLGAVTEAKSLGVVIAAAAGNENEACVSAPANLDGVLAVGAISSFGNSRASFSNWGPEVLVAAPGVNIVGTVPPGSRNLLPPYELYRVASGTSFSAPMVAGLADLLISQNPLLTPDMVKTLIQKGATPLPDDVKTPNWAGAGRIDMAASLRLVPAAYYGKVSLPGVSDGATVEARIGGQVCGSGTVSSKGGQQIYTVFVAAGGIQSGCGKPGAAVTLSIGGSPAGTATWRSAAVPLDLPGDATTTAPPSPAGSSTTSAAPAGAVLYHRGWNLVAAPAGTRIQASGTLFTLQPGDATKTGYGYWAYFAADATVAFTNAGAPSYTVQLPAGQWVLIGNPSATNEVTVTGGDIVYTYDPIAGQYQTTTKLEPGQGAWVFSASGGTVTLQ